MKLYAIYEEVYGYYKGSCAFKGVTSFRGFDLKVLTIKKNEERHKKLKKLNLKCLIMSTIISVILLDK